MKLLLNFIAVTNLHFYYIRFHTRSCMKYDTLLLWWVSIISDTVSMSKNSQNLRFLLRSKVVTLHLLKAFPLMLSIEYRSIEHLFINVPIY